MVLHALRLTVGDDAFFTTMRRYVDRFGGLTATTDDFIAVAEEVSGRSLGDLFVPWLYGTTLPEFPAP
jgi:aminopeptidase N